MTIVSERFSNKGRRIGWLAVAVLGLLLCLAAVPVIAQAKPLEQTGTFGGVAKAGEVSEESQLNGVGAMAVNYTGAGGVTKGTVYAVTRTSEAEVTVVRFEPSGEALKFVERWQVRTQFAEEINGPYSICGPAVVVESLIGSPTCSTTTWTGAPSMGIAVNQTTGNVYVSLEPGTLPVGTDIITVYSPNGSQLLSRFGEQGPSGSGNTVAETPAKIHENSPSPLAVNAAGEVFMYDGLQADHFAHRLMVFVPTVAGGTEYAYAGLARDIGSKNARFPFRPVVDQAGNIYVAGEETVEEYDPASPDTPICRFTFKPSAITAMTVDPATGEPFVYGGRTPPRIVHQLSACENGKFTETSEIAVAPVRVEFSAMTFDPSRSLSAGREPGVLYGAVPGGPPSGLGYIFAQAEEKPAQISTVAATQITQDSATLNATIDPRGFATRYTFLYVTEAEYQDNGETFAGAQEAPVGGVQLAGAGGAQFVAAPLTNLPAGASYVFKVIAESNCAPSEPTKVCSVEGSPMRFRTYSPQGLSLPDGRAFELVSPAEKFGGQVIPAEQAQKSCPGFCKPGAVAIKFPMQSSPNGDALVYEGEPFGGGGALIENEYLASRSAAGWVNRTLAPSQMSNRGTLLGYQAFNSSLSEGLISQQTPALTSGTPGEYANLYRQSSDPAGALTPLLSSTVAPTCASGHEAGSLFLSYLGSSADLSRVFFEANDVLTPESTGACGESNLYESANGALRAVNIPPGSSSSAPGAKLGSGNLVGGPPNSTVGAAISQDGSRAFFTSPDGNLYVRVGGAETLEVPDGTRCTAVTPAPERVCFLTASADGASVLLSNGQIDKLDGSGTSYESSVDLTQGLGGFEGVAGQTDDFSHLYFVDTAVLTGAEENDHSDRAQAGEANLYSWENGSLRFVAVLTGESDGRQGPYAVAPVSRSAEASPDGRYLAFRTQAPVTGPENMGFCDHRTPNRLFACPEVYLFDSQSGNILCASCNPSGESPAGQSDLLARPTVTAGAFLEQPRYLTNSGRLIFDSQDRLVPKDTNGYVEDVYEYEPAGVGSCTDQPYCVSLISAGRGASDSNFLAMDESGENIFFTTRDQLVKADQDDRLDVYDARIGGGFAESEPPSVCQGEACQPNGALAIPPGQPASASVPAESHAGPKKSCKSGFVKRKGRCVKKHGKKHQKHHKKAGRGKPSAKAGRSSANTYGKGGGR